LSRCELAVLSACCSSFGLRRAGQGVASLQMALHMAGARTAVTALWKVPDEATKDLMLDFYRRLWFQRTPKHRALWEAKMRIRGATNLGGGPKYSTADWSAWVLTGDPR
jgi:CHAT domain-containing protein